MISDLHWFARCPVPVDRGRGRFVRIRGYRSPPPSVIFTSVLTLIAAPCLRVRTIWEDGCMRMRVSIFTPKAFSSRSAMLLQSRNGRSERSRVFGAIRRELLAAAETIRFRGAITSVLMNVPRGVKVLFSRQGSGPRLTFLPVACGILGRSAPNLYDVTSRPLLLMFLFATFKIVRDTAVHDPVSLLEVVLVGVPRGSHILLRLSWL